MVCGHVKNRTKTMADDNQAQIDPATTGQGAPMPSADQQVGGDVQAPMSAPVMEVGTGVQGSVLPEDSTERTRREFEKLQQQLREERARREYAEQVYQSMQPKDPEPAATPLYDPETGLIDPDQLTDLQRQTIEANRRAEQAEKSVQSYLKAQENREVYAAYPELDPTAEKHDRSFHVETRRIMLDSMVNPEDYGGAQLSFKQAADLAKQKSIDPEQARQLGAQQALEELTTKEQASLGIGGTSDRSHLASDDLQTLQQRTRLGDKNAIIERFRRLNSQ